MAFGKHQLGQWKALDARKFGRPRHSLIVTQVLAEVDRAVLPV
jgi:hypothetical protein